MKEKARLVAMRLVRLFVGGGRGVEVTLRYVP